MPSNITQATDNSSALAATHKGVVPMNTGLWPPAKITAATETPESEVAKPVDVSGLVWADVLTLDEMEKERPAGLAGLTQKHLADKVGEKMQRRVSPRSLQKAVAFRRKRNGLE
jgi:hypothetical protein